MTGLPQELGRRTWKVKRPEYFFDPDNPNWPDEVELTLTLPPSLQEAYEDGQIRESVAIEVVHHESSTRVGSLPSIY